MIAFYLIPAAFFIYLCWEGYHSYKTTTKTAEGFLLGDRKLNPWVAAFSYTYTGQSAWMLMGFAGMCYKMGPAALWIEIGVLAGAMVALMLYPTRLGRYSRILGALTYPEYFELRVRDNTNSIRIVATITIFVFMTVYVGAQFLAGGKVINTIYGVNFSLAVLITTAVVIIYCVIGGFSAASKTDYVSGWIMTLGIIILGIWLIFKIGGTRVLATKLAAINPVLTSTTMGKTGSAAVGFIASLFLYFFGMFGRPQDTVRLFALKDPAVARRLPVIATAVQTFTMWGCMMVGLSGRVLFPALKDPEQVFPTIIGTVNPWFGAILFVILIALAISTADSILLVASSAFSRDVIQRFFKPDMKNESVVLLSRLAVPVVGIIGAIIALRTPQLMFFLTVYASNGLACTFGPALLLSLYWKRYTKWGMLASMISGFVIVVTWYNIPFLKSRLVECVPGFIGALLFGIIVTLLTKTSDEKKIAEEFKAISAVK